MKSYADEKEMVKLARVLNPISDPAFVFSGDEEADNLRFFSGSEEIKLKHCSNC